MFFCYEDSKLPYLKKEKKILQEIYSIQCEIFERYKSIFGDALFGFGGFYPRYIEQSTRVLVIGIEAYGDYIEYRKETESFVDIISVRYSEYKTKEIKELALHDRRILRVINGILNNKWDISNLELEFMARNLGGDSNSSISYAFTEFCPILNQNSTKKKDSNKIIQQYFDLDSKYHLLEQMVKLIEPDLIITENLNSLCGEIQRNCFNNLGQTTHKDSDNISRKDNVNAPLIIEYLETSSKNIPIIDTYHFSTPRGWTETLRALEDKCHLYFPSAQEKYFS